MPEGTEEALPEERPLSKEETKGEAAELIRRLKTALAAARNSPPSPEFREAASEAYFKGNPLEWWDGRRKYYISLGHGTDSYTINLREEGKDRAIISWEEAVFQVPSGQEGDPVKEPVISYQSLQLFKVDERSGKRQPLRNTPRALAQAKSLLSKFEGVLNPPVAAKSAA